MRPSPLWKSLGATEPIFTVTSPMHGQWDDRVLTHLTTTRGSTMAGLSTSTAEIGVVGDIPAAASSDQSIKIILNLYGRYLLAGLTGKSPDALAARFAGRVAAQTVTDRGDGATRQTKITAQDWPALISQLDLGANVTRDNPDLWSLYESLFNRPLIPGHSVLEPWGSQWHWVRWPPEEDGAQGKFISTSDVVGKFTADVGNLIRQTRDGKPQGLSHDFLIDKADEWRATAPDPLQRAQALAPVEWTQPATVPIRMKWVQWAAPGSTSTVTWNVRVGDDSYVTKGEELDMLHIWPIGGDQALVPAMTARVSAQAVDRYHVQQTTVDLLKLLRGGAADRAQAGQLLTLEHGDTLALGYDWPDDVAGVYFVEQVSDSITPAGWHMELQLVPANHVTGKPRPSDLAGRTWNTRYPRTNAWSTPTLQWNQH